MAAHGAAVRLKLAVSRSPQNEQAADKYIMVRSDGFVLQVVAQPLKWLLLLATTMGMCLMNGYSVVKDPQTRLPYVRKEGREFSASLPSSSLISAFTGCYLKYFLSFSIADRMDSCTD